MKQALGWFLFSWPFVLLFGTLGWMIWRTPEIIIVIVVAIAAAGSIVVGADLIHRS